MFKKFLKLALICLTLTSITYADGLTFHGRSEYYNWMERGHDPLKVDSLFLADLWSSRRFDFNPNEHFENGDFPLIVLSFPNLEYLTLNTTVHLNDESLKLLAYLPKLKGITIVGDSIFTSFSKQAFLVIAEAVPQLEEFTLTGPFPDSMIDANSLMGAIESMQKLKLLNFNTSHHSCSFNNNICFGFIKLMRLSLPVFVNGKEVKIEFDLDDKDF